MLKSVVYDILATDLLFAQTIYGKAVPFATAGDCYSAARCPQVVHVCLLLPNQGKNWYCFSSFAFLIIISQEICKWKIQTLFMNFISKAVVSFGGKTFVCVCVTILGLFERYNDKNFKLFRFCFSFQNDLLFLILPLGPWKRMGTLYKEWITSMWHSAPQRPSVMLVPWVCDTPR